MKKTKQPKQPRTIVDVVNSMTFNMTISTKQGATIETTRTLLRNTPLTDIMEELKEYKEITKYIMIKNNRNILFSGTYEEILAWCEGEE